MEDVVRVGLADIVKTAPTPQGTLLVYGRAAGETLDLDGQALDLGWLAKELPEWFKTGGNMREMHQPIAAGVGKELEFREDSQDFWLLSEAVDPVTITKLEKGVLTGYSVGIKGPKVVRDPKFPGGKIVGGKIIEVSYGDRPADPLNKVDILKTAGEPDPEASLPDAGQPLEETGIAHALADDELKTLLPDLGKRAYSSEQRAEMARKGQAIPVENDDGEIVGGRYPIADKQDLGNAIRAFGRSSESDRAEVKAFITRRARALGATDMLPEDWEGSTRGKIAKTDQGKSMWEALNMAEMSGRLRTVRDQLGYEALEGTDLILATLLDAVGWMCYREAMEASSEPDEPEEMGMTVAADQTKNETSDADGGTAPDQTKVPEADALKTLMADAVKAALADGLGPVKEELAKVTGEVLERIERLEQEPAAPKVVLTPQDRSSTLDEFTQTDALSALSALRERHQKLADEAADPTMRSAHLSKVAEIDRAIKALPGQ